MAATLHLGVVDMPYNDEDGTTTGEVAEYLENKYHLMELFFEENKDKIAKALEHALAGSLENMLMGGPVVANPMAGAEQEIKDMFDTYINLREVERLGVPGVPTQAALDGKSSRFKAGRNKGKGGGQPGTRRSSFYDTGLYVTSFRAWLEGLS